jgi:cell wall-associated NlpC family hydrolase
MTEIEERQAVIAESRTWLRTPWHHEARRKGAGVDCANYLIGVYAACELVPEFQPEHYPSDWMLHRSEQKFLHYLLQYARPVAEGKPGDIAMFSFGRTDSHGAIVVAWPRIIHAYRPERGVVLTDVSGALADRFAGFYRLNRWAS